MDQTDAKMQPPQPPHLQLLQFFTYEHLPRDLQEVSIPFAQLAAHLVEIVAPSAELTVALRKLLESKDAAVRARLLMRQE